MHELWKVNEGRLFFSHDAWSKEEMDVLYWYYEESKSYSDVIGQMVKRFGDSNFKPKYRIDVIQQLLQQVGARISNGEIFISLKTWFSSIP